MIDCTEKGGVAEEVTCTYNGGPTQPCKWQLNILQHL